MGDCEVPVLFFSDGAWEPGESTRAGAGLVVIDPVSQTRRVHQVLIPEELIELWLSLEKKQLIAELELLPVLVGFCAYKQLVKRRRVLWFIDNNSVRDMLIKGSSGRAQLLSMTAEVNLTISRSQALAWFSRVPSKSNIADYPSRGDCATAAKILVGDIGEPLQLSDEHLQLCLGSTDFVSLMKHRRRSWREEKGG